jgi:uncharacterized protein (TIGR03546 family)
MGILRIVFKFVRLLNSENSAESVAIALALGMCLGLMPLLSPQALAVVFLCLVFRVNITALLVAMGMGKLGTLVLALQMDQFGIMLLERQNLVGIWTFFYNSPVLSYCLLNNSIALTGTLAAIGLFIPVVIIATLLIKQYRNFLQPLIARSKIATMFKGFKLFRLYRRFSSPFF